MPEPTTSERVTPAWISPLILLASAAVLAKRWDQIPDRWVVHWGAGGVPNGWANKSLLGVFAPLLGGGLLWLVMEIAIAIVRARAGKDPAMAALGTATTYFLRLVSAATCLLFGLLAVSLPLGPHVAPGAIVVASLGLVLGAILIGTRRISRALEQARREGHSDRLKGYRGLFYSNPEDPRLWVPKLMGLGLTINFANPWAWPVMLLIAGIPIATVILGLLASAR